MGKMTKQNVDNIKDRFERETGARLQPSRFPGNRVLLVAAVIAVGAVLAAFSSPLFTPLEGDELSLSGKYLGNGIVSVQVKNDSDKVLTITDSKLFSWNDGEVEKLPGGKVLLENTKIEPQSEGMLTVDLSGAYDVEYLESTVPGKPKDSWHYLLLTNHSFLFGHDWMCSFHFAQEPEVLETEPMFVENPAAHTMEEIEEDLRFYFEDAYYDVLPAFNEQNFAYQQKLQELLMRTEGIFVRPVDPMLLVERPKDVAFDTVVPEEEQYRLVNQQYSSLDGYKRMVGSSFSGVTADFVLQLGGYIPTEPGENDGGVTIPLVYLATYETEAVKQVGAFAFLYGRILTFAQLEESKVYEDAQYVVYDVTDLYYTDLDAYIDTFVSGNAVYFDESVRIRLHNIRDHYREPDNLIFYYNIP